MSDDFVIYLHNDGTNYVGCFDGEWLKWPAVARGWRSRAKVSESITDDCDEVTDARLADLALRLSGAPT